MALLDPTDHDIAPRAHPDHQPTTHPILCLIGGFGFIVVSALAFHYVFNALI